MDLGGLCGLKTARIRLTIFFSHEEKPEIRAQMKQDNPLNLSILLSGGKENNHDTLSNGE